MRIALVILAAVVVGACSRKTETPEPTAAPAPLVEETDHEPSERDFALARPPATILAKTPELNARRGRILFIVNGCVICHQVNGVGGKAAPDLTATSAPDEINPLEFSARMWRGAPAMSSLQTVVLGYAINLDAEDLADLAAFAASPDEQKLLTLDSLPSEMRGWLIDEPYWRNGEWGKYPRRGQTIPQVIIEDP